MPTPEKEKSLQSLGITPKAKVYWNLPRSALYEEALRRSEGLLSHGGTFVINTQPYTGRLPNDKFIVSEPASQSRVNWGKINKPFDPAKFEALKKRVCDYLASKDLFIQDHYAGADERYRIPTRIVSERAIAALFARTMLIREKNKEKMLNLVPQFTILHAPGFKAAPARDGTRSEAFILLNFAQKMVMIGGTYYLGEIKKSIFSVMNYLLPEKGVLPMHCSTNYGRDENDAAIFFGLSGTGKTTLSAAPDRTLVGDDEHGWSDHGIFNFEGGCYAKVIRLSKEGEPEIFATTGRFGTILENVVIDPETRAIDLNDDSITENTRATYPISHIPNMTLSGQSGHPKNILMLTADAFGILPPVSRLTKEQAMYHFISGYTAKVAGTESGVKEPQATFSPCFGGPFMPLPPAAYAKLLGEKITKYDVRVWLVNTGWSGGAYPNGKRMDLAVTRAIVKAILDGSLAKIETRIDPHFGLAVPIGCPGVPPKILDPKLTWKDPAAYEKKAGELARMFQEHFLEQCGPELRSLTAVGPQV
ncbi:MAG TPA: phosphoenolpyruvate carboxykinase (ATP) [Verrucomicrobiae bacterium]|jgi:phosphoenolpyruvate carboxykinase (ATP)|nr:phosphoenolpyruvate carboxykinase (ATP) [Verrucomicrobiae bacterium]